MIYSDTRERSRTINVFCFVCGKNTAARHKGDSMKKVYAFIANGSEEAECLNVVDLLRRAHFDVTLVSVESERGVVSSHNVAIIADKTFGECDFSDGDAFFLPGGMPGTNRLAAHAGLCGLLTSANKAGKRLAAICAAPSVLGRLGLLKGRKATCFPGFESYLEGAKHVSDGVVTDGNITTARGLGFAIDLGLELIALLESRDKSDEIKRAIQYN